MKDTLLVKIDANERGVTTGAVWELKVGSTLLVLVLVLKLVVVDLAEFSNMEMFCAFAGIGVLG